MLKRLSIDNYVFIQKLQLNFEKGFQVLTGETGAGKSILLDALSLALGERFNKDAILHEDQKCVIEVEFSSHPQVDELLKAWEFDLYESIIIRREWIPPSFRTRSFINDTPCTVEQIQKLSSYLVDLHRQFDHLQLFRNDFEIETLDALAGNTTLFEQYKQVFFQLKQFQKRKTELEAIIENSKREHDDFKQTINEVEQLNIKEGEIDQLEKLQKKISNAEALNSALYQAYHILEEADESLISRLAYLQKEVERFQMLDSSVQQLAERLESQVIELKDIASTAFDLHQGAQADDQKLQDVEQRLSAIYTLLKKYQQPNIESLLHRIENIKKELQDFSHSEEELSLLIQKINTSQKEANTLAQQLSKTRLEHQKILDQKINVLLKQVGMPNAKWKTEIQALAEMNNFGLDEVRFLVDINHIGHFSPLEKVASGGELSRIMLCLKTILAYHIDLNSMIFDEIDVGVSGETAKNIARLLAELGEKKQIICITHQASVAAAAKYHFFVSKSSANGVVATQVEQLQHTERVRAIAEMIGGSSPSPSSLLHAEEMLKRE